MKRNFTKKLVCAICISLPLAMAPTAFAVPPIISDYVILSDYLVPILNKTGKKLLAEFNNFAKKIESTTFFSDYEKEIFKSSSDKDQIVFITKVELKGAFLGSPYFWICKGDMGSGFLHINNAHDSRNKPIEGESHIKGLAKHADKIRISGSTEQEKAFKVIEKTIVDAIKNNDFKIELPKISNHKDANIIFCHDNVTVITNTSGRIITAFVSKSSYSTQKAQIPVIEIDTLMKKSRVSNLLSIPRDKNKNILRDYKDIEFLNKLALDLDAIKWYHGYSLDLDEIKWSCDYNESWSKILDILENESMKELLTLSTNNIFEYAKDENIHQKIETILNVKFESGKLKETLKAKFELDLDNYTGEFIKKDIEDRKEILSEKIKDLDKSVSKKKEKKEELKKKFKDEKIINSDNETYVAELLKNLNTEICNLKIDADENELKKLKNLEEELTKILNEGIEKNLDFSKKYTEELMNSLIDFSSNNSTEKNKKEIEAILNKFNKKSNQKKRELKRLNSAKNIIEQKNNKYKINSNSWKVYQNKR